jgi:hypothetical protein
MHLSTADLSAALSVIRRSSARWLLATTFDASGRDIQTGQFRAINLEHYLWPCSRKYQDNGKWLGLWDLQNTPTCPACLTDDPLPIPEQSHPRDWANLPETRNAHATALAAVLTRDFQPPGNLVGDGILTCGEGKYWPGIVVMVRLLRELGCMLPVQIWSRGDTGHELDGESGVTFVDANEFRQRHPARILRGWEIKHYALLHSGFRRAFFIDADAYFVADPTPLFSLLDDSPFVYWQDFDACWNNVHWEWYGIENETIPPVQGGQLLIDIERFWRETMIGHWLNQHSEYFFKHQFGDQDSWKAAMAGAGTRGRFTSLGKARFDRMAFVCEWQSMPYVVHRTNAKLFGSTPRSNRRLPMEDRILELYRAMVPPEAPEPQPVRVARLRADRQRVLARR